MINAPSLTVHWTAPCSLEEVKYDVHSYIVTLHYSTSPGSSNEDIQVLSEVEANQDLQFTHNLGTTAGAYRFGVQIVDPACGTNGCRVSFSPTITSEGEALTAWLQLFGHPLPKCKN
ncbi:hypothetical protein PR048_006767 [Dryococelus australis]|uniref:Fibronectin type-III domain-containing protein n=1 Tax=Dryococelus australis TaxID=614101 RepID=A0ABQ9ICH5_9NEOP|nr:hypothetical protein PR048_006767 [Dryococelus australis]